jgi:thiamine-phosphate diphosphorylase/hydroxyethylthiazole kinase
MKKQGVDYTLYLVTDSTPRILRGKNICDVVEAALKGGVTCVQYRDKTSDTGELIRIARELHSITKRYRVPLLINDRVDVALAIGCEGCHVGQDDMSMCKDEPKADGESLTEMQSLRMPDDYLGRTQSLALAPAL